MNHEKIKLEGEEEVEENEKINRKAPDRYSDQKE
jgi:hypothetical protein